MKKNILVYVIILIFACALTGTLTYIYMNNQNNETEIKDNNIQNEEENNKNQEDNNKVVLEDGVKLLTTEWINDIIGYKVAIQKYQIILNGNEKIIEVAFTYNRVYDFNGYQEVKGTINNYTVSYFFDPDLDYSVDELLSADRLYKEFSEKNFKIIKGTDNKNYLAIISNTKQGPETYNDTAVYIYNDNLELLTKDLSSYYSNTLKVNYMTIQSGATSYKLDDETKWYQDNFKLCKNAQYEWCNIGIKFENDSIYYLYPKPNFNSASNYGYMEERVYTINNNKLEYKVLNKYQIIDIAGQVE